MGLLVESTQRVKVTDRHLLQGAQNSCWSCPIALAICEQFKRKLGEVSVSGVITIVDENGKKAFYDIPEVARNFIDAFDHYADAKPFEFDLVIFSSPDETYLSVASP